MKVYLGDSVYADLHPELPDAIVLTTENGEPGELASNFIVLEPEVLENLLAYVRARKLRIRFPQ